MLAPKYLVEDYRRVITLVFFFDDFIFRIRMRTIES